MATHGNGDGRTSSISPLLQLVHTTNSFTKADEAAALSGTPPASKPLYIADTLVGIVPAFAHAAFAAATAVFHSTPSRITMLPSLSTYDSRSAAVAALLASWRSSAAFECLAGWRNERYDVYGPGSTKLLAIERSAVGLFGVRSFGCHLNGYVRVAADAPNASAAASAVASTSAASEIRMWIARRSYTKPTNPGMLDNMVGGGLPCGVSPTANMIKECSEEAGIPAAMACKARPTGTVAIWVQSPTRGLIPDTEYVYDLELSTEFVPVAADGEVHEFFLWDLSTVKERLVAGEFTAEAGLVVLDFLIRFGVVTPENEPAYLDILDSLRRPFPFHGPSHFAA
ncbi:hypothetical protein BC831DRAFT_447504 [Entophlyctis helioformis]|nr:hypothetical protein BC831DRAFT_447504 [Entophlyctis helioformis]